MYSDIRSQVKLQGELSEYQGIRQEGQSSTDLFKAKSNPMLRRASIHPLEYRIGSIPVSAPTAADDTALIAASRLGVHTLIGIAQTDANQQRYN